MSGLGYPALFIGRRTSHKRGGRLIFDVLFDEFPERKELVEIDSTGKHPILRSLISEVSSIKRLKKIDTKRIRIVIIQHNDLRELGIAILLKLMNSKIYIVGPLYHIEKDSLNPFKTSLKKILVLINQKLSLFVYIACINIVITENNDIKKLLSSYNNGINVIVKSPGAEKKALNFIASGHLNWRKDVDILYLGAMSNAKGVFDFISAIRLLDHFNLTVAIAGFANNKISAEVSREVSKIKTLKVELYFNISDDLKFKLLSRSKILVVPSYFEGIPITFYEAMLFRVIVITYYLPSYQSILNRIIVSPAGDIKSISDEIYKTLIKINDFGHFIDDNYTYSSSHTSQIIAKEIIRDIFSLVESNNK